MICWKLDAQLQTLAKKTQCTYTRYADDITFSFSAKKNKLPLSIIRFEGADRYSVGQPLSTLIEENGFKINKDKVRLQESSQRQEVTCLTVNRKVNIKRSFIRQTNSMLHAWKKFGAVAAEDHYLNKYRDKQLAPWQEENTAKNPGEFFKNVVKGRINYIQMVRGRYDPLYRKLAFKFTENLGKPNTDFKKSFDELATLVLTNNIMQSQGTGFLLEGFGLITNAHVTEEIDSSNDELLEIHHFDTSKVLMRAFHIYSSLKYDISIFSPSNEFKNLPRFTICEEEQIQQGQEIKVIGFPSYSEDSIPYINEGKIVSRRPYFELTVWIVDTPINHGCSGAPILNKKNQVIGIATFGTAQDDGSTEYNGFIPISTLISQTKNLTYIIKKYEADNRNKIYELKTKLKKNLKGIKETKNTYYFNKQHYCRACFKKGDLIALSPTKSKSLSNCKICMKTLKI